VKLFLSWSGKRSELVAAELYEWLPLILDDVDLFISSDIDVGTRWQSKIADELGVTDFGILCVTAENQRAPWLNFEAGALANAIGTSGVIPLAVDLSPAEIQNPLGQFQAQRLDRPGMERIVKSINGNLPKPQPDGRIDKKLDRWWPEFDQKIQVIKQASSLNQDFEQLIRTDRELLEDILNTVRGLSRTSEHSDGRLEDMGNTQRTRELSAVRRLVGAGVIKDGTVLTVHPQTGINVDARRMVVEWLAKQPGRSRATWKNDTKNPLRWHVNGDYYSPSGLVRLIVREATGTDRSLQGTQWWFDSDERNLVEIAATLPEGKATL
jgi:hypothetical protein